MTGKSSNQHLTTGKAAEQFALEFLRHNGLRHLLSNVSYKFGEIDHIMRDADEIVFVEVRYRRNNRYGSGFESITHAKKSRLRKAAEYFLQSNPDISFQSSRFDVVSLSPGSPQYKVDWIKDAF